MRIPLQFNIARGTIWRMKTSSLLLVTALVLAPSLILGAEAPVAIESRRELFVDRLLVGELKGTALKLHEPVLAEPLAKGARPDGHYATVLKADDQFQFYY